MADSLSTTDVSNYGTVQRDTFITHTHTHTHIYMFVCVCVCVCVCVQAVRHIGGVEVYVQVKCTVVQALRFCTGRTVHRGSRGIGKGKVHRCTGTEVLYRP